MENTVAVASIIAGAVGALAITLGLIQARTVLKFYGRISTKVSQRMQRPKSLDEHLNVLASEQQALLARLDRIESEMRDLRNRIIHVREKESEAESSAAQGELPAAAKNYLEALDLYEVLGFPRRSAEISLRLGQLYRQLGDTQHALQYSRRALEAFYALGEYQRLADAVASVAAAYQELGQIPNALKQLEQARDVLEKSGVTEAARKLAEQMAALRRGSQR